MRISKYQVLFSALIIIFTISGCASGLSSNDISNGKIVYQSGHDGNHDLYLINPDGSGKQNITNLPPSTSNANNNFAPIPSPDGKQIAFISDRDGNDEVYVIDIDSGVQINLSKNKTYDSSPAWSTNGQKIAYVSNRDGNYEIYVVDSDGGKQYNLTNDIANDYAPKWSPDGKNIAFISDRDTRTMNDDSARVTNDVYIMEISSDTVKRLTENRGEIIDLAWSPDGKMIALTSSIVNNDAFYTGSIILLDINENTQMKLTSSFSASLFKPMWSPNGIQILYIESASRLSKIKVMDADGNNQIDFHFDSSGLQINPYWSPDGKYIVFSYRQNDDYDLYIVNADGTNLTRVTSDPGDETNPVWLPMP